MCLLFTIGDYLLSCITALWLGSKREKVLHSSRSRTSQLLSSKLFFDVIKPSNSFQPVACRPPVVHRHLSGGPRAKLKINCSIMSLWSNLSSLCTAHRIFSNN